MKWIILAAAVIFIPPAIIAYSCCVAAGRSDQDK